MGDPGGPGAQEHRPQPAGRSGKSTFLGRGAAASPRELFGACVHVGVRSLLNTRKICEEFAVKSSVKM